MADLSGVLGRVPGLAGYIGAGQLRQQEDAGELQKASQLMQILGAAQQQQQRQAAMAREQAFRSGLRPDMTDDEQMRYAQGFIRDPKDLTSLIQNRKLKQEQEETRKEAIRGRLAATARDLDFKYEALRSKVTNGDQDRALKQWYQQNKLAIENEGLKLTGAKVFYETGERPTMGVPLQPPPAQATAQPMAQPAPSGGDSIIPTPQPQMRPGQVPTPASFPRGAALGPRTANPVLPPFSGRMSPEDTAAEIEAGKLALAAARTPQEKAAIEADIATLQQSIATNSPLAVPGAVPGVQPVANTGPQMPDWVKARPKKFQDAWLQAQMKDDAETGKATNKAIIKELAENYSRLRDAPQALGNIEKAKALINKDSRIFQGSLGEQKLAVAKFFNNNLGMNINTSGVENAEELRSRIFFNIMDNLKKMDAQPSQLQQQIMMESLGKLGTDPGALPKVLDAFGEVIREKVAGYDKQVKEAEGKNIRWPHRIDIPKGQGGIPEFATEAEAAAANLAPGTRVKIGGKTGTWR